MTTLRAKIKQFQNNEQGNMIMIAAVFMPLILAVMMLALDYGRAMSVRGHLQRASDSALQSAARHFKDAREARTLFDANFRANLPDHLKAIPYLLHFDTGGSVASVKVQHNVSTSVAKLAGIEKINVSVAAQEPIHFQQRPNNYARSKNKSPQRSAARKQRKKINRRKIAKIKAHIEKLRKLGLPVRKLNDRQLEALAEQL